MIPGLSTPRNDVRLQGLDRVAFFVILDVVNLVSGLIMGPTGVTISVIGIWV